MRIRARAGLRRPARELHILEEVRGLARNLGGKWAELQGDSIAEELIKYVRESGAALIVMGQSARRRWNEIVRGSIVNRSCASKECGHPSDRYTEEKNERKS